MKAMQRPMMIYCVLFLTTLGCDDTRLYPEAYHLDSFVQDGEPIQADFTQMGQNKIITFEQNGFHQVDAFTQKASAEVDILWVVDNSASMQEEQLNLGLNFNSFISFIDSSLIDYHIAVISTDMDSRQHMGQIVGNPRVITKETPNPQASFAANVQVGIVGTGYEMGLLAAHTALSPPLIHDQNKDFLRDEASLAVIFVSDEDDKSFGEIAYYDRFFNNIKGIGNDRKVILAAIIGDAPDGCRGDDGKAEPGIRYHELIESLQGTTASICADDFAAELEQLGLTVAGLGRHFRLSKEPDPESIVVRVDDHTGAGFVEIPEDAQSGWRYQPANRTIFFDGDYVPGPQAEIQVEYGNLDHVVRLTSQVNPITLEVWVDPDGAGPLEPQQKQEGTEWIYDAENNSIVFMPEHVPPQEATIEIRFSDLQTEFPLPKPVNNRDTLKIEVDPQDGGGFRPVLEDSVNGWMYHQASNQILFKGNSVPQEGWDLRVSYSNLTWLFALSKNPVQSSLTVQLDLDGEGTQHGFIEIPAYDAQHGISGYIYYPNHEMPAYANTISFENTTWPPQNSLLTVSYRLAAD